MRNSVILPKIWKDWEIVELIGSGSYGTVYKARKKESEAESISAIKIIKIPKDEVPAELKMSIGSDIEVINDYYFNQINDCILESKIMDTLRENKNIVKIEDSFIRKNDNGIGWTLYLRMEYLTPFTDATNIDFEGNKESEAVKLGIDICNALSACEKFNILHRDIKISNILVSSDGVYKLGDFGVAKNLEGTNGASTVMGTFSNMAPEVYHGEHYDKRSDIYSLGILLYKLLNNNRDPFVDISKKLIYQKDLQDSLSKRMNGDIMPDPINASSEFSEIIIKACEFLPENRYQNFDELKKDLVALLNGKYRLKNRKKRKSSKKHIQMKHLLRIIMPLITCICILCGIMTSYIYKGENYIFYQENCGKSNNLVASLSKDGVLTISGNGTLKHSRYNYPWQNNRKEIKVVKLTGNIDKIGAYAFENCTELTSISGLNNVTEIGKHAFENCENIISIDNLENIDTIGAFAFAKCNKLESIGNLNKLEKISKHAFRECESLERVDGLENLKEINSYAFSKCTNLTTITGLTKLEIIEDSAFNECNKLRQIESLSELNKIGSYAFHDCIALTSLENLGKLTEIEDSAFSGCENLENFSDLNIKGDIPGTVFDDTKYLKAKTDKAINCYVEGTRLVRCCSSEKDITIESNITSISPGAFKNCDHLETITFNNKVKNIPDNAFKCCSKLKEIKGLNNISTIGEEAFSNCISLTSVDNLTSVKLIKKKAFYKCYNLTSIGGLKNLNPNEKGETIGDEAFANCSLLKDIPDLDLKKIKKISGTAFDNTAYLTAHLSEDGLFIKDKQLIRCSVDKQEVELKGIYSICANAFKDCSELKSVSGLQNIATIKRSTFEGCSSLETIEDLKKIKIIGNSAFKDCSKLNSIRSLKNVTKIGESAFENCIALKKIDTLDNLTKIENSAFKNCSRLESITGLHKLESIGGKAFSGCTNLENLENIDKATYTDTTFDSCPNFKIDSDHLRITKKSY